MTYKIIFLLFLSVLSTLLSCSTVLKEDPQSKIYYNGSIITMEGLSPNYVEALVVQEGKIAYLGNKEIAKSKFPNAIKVNLQNLTLLPGFIDPHSHIGMVINTMGQANLSSPPIGKIKNYKDIINELLSYAQKKKIQKGQWIFAWGYDENELEEKKHITKKELDKYFPNNPVYLQHTSGHMGVANSSALKIANITSSTKNPKGGIIARFAGSDEPNGLVQEVAMYFFAEKSFLEFESIKASLFDKAVNYYTQYGITTAQDGMTDPTTLKFFEMKAANKELKIDIISLPGADFLKTNPLVFGKYHNGLKFVGIKIVLDGSPQGRTAYFTKRYLTKVPQQDSSYRGFSNMDQDELNRIFIEGYKNNKQLFVHINGDAAIDMFIKAHVYACNKLSQPLDKDRRTVAIHSQFVRNDQLKLFKKYNIMPSFFSNHAYFWGDIHIANLGIKRASFLSPLKSASDLELVFTNHTDTIVTPINQMFSLWSAVNRVTRSGFILGENERVTPYEGLKAITINAAKQIFDEKIKGSFEVGKLADMVILDKNPLTEDLMKIKNIKVIETIKEGKTVFNQNTK